MKSNIFEHRHLKVNDYSVHLIETGDKKNQTILFIHGYPESWKAFEKIMVEMKKDYHLMAIDLPGIGKSEKIAASDKKTIAKFISELIEILDLKNLIVVGHDIGGMITYSLIKNYPRNISKAVLMNTAIPGIEPWEEVKANPYIWHFAFFAIPSLPEILIDGNQDKLFDYFFDTTSAKKNIIDLNQREQYVQAYNNLSSLKISLNWYRAFPLDEKDNSKNSAIDIPILYIKGEKDFGKIEKYINGLKKNGAKNIIGELISNSGHFTPEENPNETAKVIHKFIAKI